MFILSVALHGNTHHTPQPPPLTHIAFAGLAAATLLVLALGSFGARAEPDTPARALTVAQAPQPQTRGTGTTGWVEFESRSSGFRVLFPTKPRQGRKTIRTDIGEVVSTRFTATDVGFATYDVLHSEYPKAGVARINPQKLLEGARDSLVYQTNGRLVTDRQTTLGNFPARDQEIVAADGTRYRVRLVMAGNRLYQVLAITRDRARADAQAFLDSFRLLDAR
ncbi:MAG: hypothetical protein HY526_09690 [Betaproteobacteria bacterium]|nr:hypothetical protein [Betaproteobacteria bacterium]